MMIRQLHANFAHTMLSICQPSTSAVVCLLRVVVRVCLERLGTESQPNKYSTPGLAFRLSYVLVELPFRRCGPVDLIGSNRSVRCKEHSNFSSGLPAVHKDSQPCSRQQLAGQSRIIAQYSSEAIRVCHSTIRRLVRSQK